MSTDQGASAKADRAATASQPSQSSVVSGTAGIPCASAFDFEMVRVAIRAGEPEADLLSRIDRLERALSGTGFPLNEDALRAFGNAEIAWSTERATTVKWLRLVAQARDDRADPEWALALNEAADFIERGEHLDCGERVRDELAAQAQELHMGYDAEPAESCAVCCGPVDDDGMTLATPLLNEQQESMVAAMLAKARGGQ